MTVQDSSCLVEDRFFSTINMEFLQVIVVDPKLLTYSSVLLVVVVDLKEARPTRI